jgi:RNA polymerase sigma-70 factor (ECF subfamily)
MISDRGNILMLEKGVGLDRRNKSQRRVTMTKQNDNEAAMIASILGGDAQLYHDLIRPHERSVYMMALSFVKNEADAEDIAQEAFLKAFCNLASFRAESKFSTWLISITLNEARSRLRRQPITRMESLDESPDDGGVVSPALLRDWREIPSEAIERLEIHQLLRQAVISLPAMYRQVFQLRDVTELSIQDTAEALGLSVPCVKVRLHRARMMLQNQLSPLLKRVNPSQRGGRSHDYKMQHV